MDRRILTWWGCAVVVGLGMACLLGGCALVQSTVLEVDEDGSARAEVTGWQLGDQEVVVWADPVTGGGFASLSSDRSGTRWLVMGLSIEARKAYLAYLRAGEGEKAAALLEDYFGGE